MDSLWQIVIAAKCLRGKQSATECLRQNVVCLLKVTSVRQDPVARRETAGGLGCRSGNAESYSFLE